MYKIENQFIFSEKIPQSAKYGIDFDSVFCFGIPTLFIYYY